MTVAELEGAGRRVLEADRKLQKRRGSRRIELEGERRVGLSLRAEGRAFTAQLALLRPTWEGGRDRLREAPGEGEWGPAWDRAAREVSAIFTDSLAWIIAEGTAAGARAMIAHLGLRAGDAVSLDLANPRAVTWAEREAAATVRGIDEATRGQMRTLLTQAVDEGWSYSRTAREINARFRGFTARVPLRHIQNRAELIAVTETAKAYEQGNRLMAEQLRSELPPGIFLEKSWLTVGDERVDEEQCAPNEAEGWIPFEESHTSGHDEPPAHPGCRCTELYQTVRVRGG